MNGREESGVEGWCGRNVKTIELKVLYSPFAHPSSLIPRPHPLVQLCIEARNSALDFAFSRRSSTTSICSTGESGLRTRRITQIRFTENRFTQNRLTQNRFTQRGEISLTVRCPVEACVAGAQAEPRRRVRNASAVGVDEEPVTLTLRSRSARGARLLVTVTAVDESGNATRKQRRITLLR